MVTRQSVHTAFCTQNMASECAGQPPRQPDTVHPAQSNVAARTGGTCAVDPRKAPQCARLRGHVDKSRFVRDTHDLNGPATPPQSPGRPASRQTSGCGGSTKPAGDDQACSVICTPLDALRTSCVPAQGSWDICSTTDPTLSSPFSTPPRRHSEAEAELYRNIATTGYKPPEMCYAPACPQGTRRRSKMCLNRLNLPQSL